MPHRKGPAVEKACSALTAGKASPAGAAGAAGPAGAAGAAGPAGPAAAAGPAGSAGGGSQAVGRRNGLSGRESGKRSCKHGCVLVGGFVDNISWLCLCLCAFVWVVFRKEGTLTILEGFACWFLFPTAMLMTRKLVTSDGRHEPLSAFAVHALLLPHGTKCKREAV